MNFAIHDNRTSPVSRDPGIAEPVSRLTGLRFFHVITFAGPARLIKPIRVQNQARSGFPRSIASAINRAGSPHVIPAESHLGTLKQPGSCNQGPLSVTVHKPREKIPARNCFLDDSFCVTHGGLGESWTTYSLIAIKKRH